MKNKNSNPYHFDFNDWLSACEKLITLYQKKLNRYNAPQNRYQTAIKKSPAADLKMLQEKYESLKKLTNTTFWLSYHQFDEQYDKEQVFAYLYSQGFIKELYESAKHTFNLDNTKFNTASFAIFNEQVAEFWECILDAWHDYNNQIGSLSEDYDSSSNPLMDDMVLGNETTDKQTVFSATCDQEEVNGELLKYCETLRKQYLKPSETEIANREQQKAKDSKKQLEQKNEQIETTVLAERQNIRIIQTNLTNQQSCLKNLEAEKVTKIEAVDFRYKACQWLKNSRNPFIKPIQYFFGTKINNHLHKIESEIKKVDNKIQAVQASIQTFESTLKASQTSIEQVTEQFKQNESHINDLKSKLEAIASLQSKLSGKTKPIDSRSQTEIQHSAVKFGH